MAVGIVGGVAAAAEPLHRAFRDRVYRSTLAEIARPRFPMVVAAVCMAIEEVGVQVDEPLWGRLAEQMERFGLQAVS